MNYPNSHCAVLVFALDNTDTFKYITSAPPEEVQIGARTLVEEVTDVLPGVPIILVGAKSDLPRAVTKEEAEQLASKIGAKKYMEFSDKDWDSMNEIFKAAVGEAVAHHLQHGDGEEAKPDKPAGGGGANKGSSCCTVL
uniref:Uncharacterized protein n=1 Tax=Arcella intermedia TaxID=1963864 RepID=A0A6B2LJB7_9EUKA